MIFTIKPLKVILNDTDKPIENFLEVSNKTMKDFTYAKQIHFTRYIGIDTTPEQYIEQIKKIDEHFAIKEHGSYPCLRLDHLDVAISTVHIDRITSILEQYNQVKKGLPQDLFAMQFPFKFKNEILEWTMKIAFGKALKIFKESNKNSTESIHKNFSVKMLYWIEIYLPKLFQNTEDITNWPKIVYTGEIKRQELLFMYFLSQLGCDILYMNPQKDIEEIYPESRIFSKLHKCPIQYTDSIEIPVYQKPQKIDSMHAKKEKVVPIVQKNGNLEKPNNIIKQNDVTKQVNELAYEELANLSKSIVMIKVYDRNNQLFKGGSGVVINESGYILTNFHVVEGGTGFLVQFENDEESYSTSTIVKYHPSYDLAIIKVDRPCKKIPVKTSKKLVRGQKIAAIGSPLGLFNTVSDGIVSAFREIGGKTMIQFTAPISNGSSGGALLDMFGNLVGLITAGFDEGQNLNLAVSSEEIYLFANNFVETV